MGRAEDQDLRAEERATAGPPKWATDHRQPPPYDKDASLDRIRNDIHHTRSEMDETIDALSAKLQPRQIMDEALSWVGIGGHAALASGQSRPYDRYAVIKTELQKKARDAAITGGKVAGKATWRAIKRHPLPAAMILGGIVWAFLESGKRRRQDLERYVYNPDTEYSGSYVDARTGKAYHEETYTQAAAPMPGDVRNPQQFEGAHEVNRESRWPEEDLAADERVAGTSRRQPRPQPDPTHSGSYVDARTGEPYDEERYGQDVRGSDDLSTTQDKEGQR